MSEYHATDLFTAADTIWQIVPEIQKNKQTVNLLTTDMCQKLTENLIANMHYKISTTKWLVVAGSKSQHLNYLCNAFNSKTYQIQN